MKRIWDTAGYQGAVAAQATMFAAFVVLTALAALEATRPKTDASQKTGDARSSYLVDTKSLYRDPTDSHYLSAAIATALAEFLSLPFLSFRPVTAAIVLLAGCGWLIARDRRKGETSRSLWLVVPITILLANIHLFAMLVPVWAIALLFGAAWECIAGDETSATGGAVAIDRGAGGSAAASVAIARAGRHTENLRRLFRYALFATACCIACLLTPMLPGMIATAFHYGTKDPMVDGPVIAETQKLWHGTPGQISAILILGFLVGVFQNRSRVRAGELLWLAFAGVLLVKMARFAPVFAVSCAPVFAATRPKLSDRVLAKPSTAFALATILLLGLMRITLEFPAGNEPIGKWLNRNGPDAPNYPCAAADFVADHIAARGASGRVINEFSWGGYLEWRLGPKFKTLLDGRTQLFAADFWHDTYLNGEDSRRKKLATLAADAAVLPAKGSLFEPGLTQLGWRVAFKDDYAEVMLPPAGNSTPTATPTTPPAAPSVADSR
jgi:hypothetical protein